MSADALERRSHRPLEDRARRALRDQARRALTDARPVPFWTDRPDAPDADEPLVGEASADLAIVGAGLTGLWAADLAAESAPGSRIVVLEATRVASGASGRNGGFISASLTHGLAHGLRTWPHEIDRLLELGRRNLAEVGEHLERHGIEADLRLCGQTRVAVEPHQAEALRLAARAAREHGEDASYLDGDEVRADVASPTYLGGMRLRSSNGLVDPARLTWGLARVAREQGVRIHEDSPVVGLRDSRDGVELRTPRGILRAPRVLLATNAFPALLRRLRSWILPVYDYVLVTEPLGDSRWATLGWSERQGMADAGNRFHYYRPTADGRILWGGWDAIYHFGGRVDPSLEQRDDSHLRLARHFLATFPQLEGVRFTHRWGGAIDSTSRFTPLFGTAMGGRVAYAVGYTGLGVGSSRFGAQVALDLLEGRRTERTELAMVRRKPLPFPPEPLRWLGVRITTRELAREDRTGRRGIWLRLLDRLGMGFAS